ncbi:unnamed protein product [Vitrella brassicaformis CCMP3155]|uniref:SUEL-type lectin domain-containing protein n=1 Tax=Vitrella brassicaformis (strain CCMP3155) TaxID=1169540 RepID=A0A0G4EDB0_VITBC|nr:unnamed protein product [Vitrella brassicaformis CCMP3155]|eukprot:CEL93672.1 unnamed protein product [Vitrella brassicaformis CCMP3155]
MRFGFGMVVVVGLAAIVQPLLAAQRNYARRGEMSVALEAQQMSSVQLQLDHAKSTLTAAHHMHTTAQQLTATAMEAITNALGQIAAIAGSAQKVATIKEDPCSVGKNEDGLLVVHWPECGGKEPVCVIDIRRTSYAESAVRGICLSDQDAQKVCTRIEQDDVFGWPHKFCVREKQKKSFWKK